MSLRLSRLLFALAIAVALSACTGPGSPADQAAPRSPESSTARMPEAKAAELKAAESKAADSKADDSKQQNLAPVLNPSLFTGSALMGYSAAKGCPHVCNHLFCYCGCDISDGHKCLLDCFTGMHGADCPICQEEAMVALHMSRNDEPLAAIQKKIDEAYSAKYPYHQGESPALKHYKSIRKWQPAAGNSAGGGPESSR